MHSFRLIQVCLVSALAVCLPVQAAARVAIVAQAALPIHGNVLAPAPWSAHAVLSRSNEHRSWQAAGPLDLCAGNYGPRSALIPAGTAHEFRARRGMANPEDPHAGRSPPAFLP